MVQRPSPAPLTLAAWLAQWLRSTLASGCLISAVLHALALLAFSFVYLQSDRGPTGIDSLFVSQGDPTLEPAEIDVPVGRIELDGGVTSGSVLTSEILTSIDTAFAPLASDALGYAPRGSEGTGAGEGSGHGAGLADGFPVPSSGKTVTKGSFTAWTVPADPAPGEEYLIVIQVKFPKETQTLKIGDITGSVLGTDNFRLLVSPATSRYYPKSNQVVVRIPGAQERVKDTIRVRSRALRESQVLEIEF